MEMLELREELAEAAASAKRAIELASMTPMCDERAGAATARSPSGSTPARAARPDAAAQELATCCATIERYLEECDGALDGRGRSHG